MDLVVRRLLTDAEQGQLAALNLGFASLRSLPRRPSTGKNELERRDAYREVMQSSASPTPRVILLFLWGRTKPQFQSHLMGRLRAIQAAQKKTGSDRGLKEKSTLSTAYICTTCDNRWAPAMVDGAVHYDYVRSSGFATCKQLCSHLSKWGHWPFLNAHQASPPALIHLWTNQRPLIKMPQPLSDSEVLAGLGQRDEVKDPLLRRHPHPDSANKSEIPLALLAIEHKKTVLREQTGGTVYTFGRGPECPPWYNFPRPREGVPATLVAERVEEESKGLVHNTQVGASRKTTITTEVGGKPQAQTPNHCGKSLRDYCKKIRHRGGKEYEYAVFLLCARSDALNRTSLFPTQWPCSQCDVTTVCEKLTFFPKVLTKLVDLRSTVEARKRPGSTTCAKCRRKNRDEKVEAHVAYDHNWLTFDLAPMKTFRSAGKGECAKAFFTRQRKYDEWCMKAGIYATGGGKRGARGHAKRKGGAGGRSQQQPSKNDTQSSPKGVLQPEQVAQEDDQQLLLSIEQQQQDEPDHNMQAQQQAQQQLRQQQQVHTDQGLLYAWVTPFGMQ